MSRGLGKIQRGCLAVFQSRKTELLDTLEIAAAVVGRDEITVSDQVTVRRALRNLAKAGHIVDRGRGYSDKRQRWELATAAKTSQRTKRRGKHSDLHFEASKWKEIEGVLIEVLTELGKWSPERQVFALAKNRSWPEVTSRPQLMGLGEMYAFRYQLRSMLRRGLVESRTGGDGQREYRLVRK